ARWRTQRPWRPPCRTWCSWKRRACAPSSSTAAASRSTGPWPPPACRRARSRAGATPTAPPPVSWSAVFLGGSTPASCGPHAGRRGGAAVALPRGRLQALFGGRLTLPAADGRPVDLGHVGRVTRVDGDVIRDLCAGSVVPVIPSLALDNSAATPPGEEAPPG